MSNLSIENIGFNHLINSELNQISRTGESVRIDRDKQEGGVADDGNKVGGVNFADALKQSIDQVNEYQKNADSAIKNMAAGKTKNIHETMLAIEKADMSLKLMMQVRNKVLDAYKEIMRMQV